MTRHRRSGPQPAATRPRNAGSATRRCSRWPAVRASSALCGPGSAWPRPRARQTPADPRVATGAGRGSVAARPLGLSSCCSAEEHRMHALVAADQVEILVLVDNVTDNLSLAPAYVENELPRLWRRGLR